MSIRRLLISGLLWMLISCSVPGPEKPAEMKAPAATTAQARQQPAVQPVEQPETVAEETAPVPATSAANTLADSAVVTEDKVDPRARAMYIAALDTMRAGKDAEAEQQLLQMTLDFPELSGPHTNLGILHYRAGKKNTAKGDFMKALSLNPASVTSLNYLGIISREEGRFQEAYDFYLEALSVDPGYATAHLNLGILLDLYLGNLQEALVHYKQYQALTDDVDETVRNWIVDLSRRVEK